MAVNVAGWRNLYSRDPSSGLVYAVSSIGPSGPPGEAGLQGPTGPVGASGPAGQSTVMVGEFNTRLPADLPPDGVIPADWDGSGTFPGGLVMELGQSLIHNNPADQPNFGFLYTFVATGDPTGYIRVGQVVGPQGIEGPTGPWGPTGPGGDEVWSGPELPTGAPTGQYDLWWDSDEPQQAPYLLDDYPRGFVGQVGPDPKAPNMGASVAGGAANTWKDILVGTVDGISPDRYYQISAGIRCVADAGADVNMNIALTAGSSGLSFGIFDDYLTSSGANVGLWSAWSQQIVVAGSKIINSTGMVTFTLKTKVSIANLLVYLPRVTVVDVGKVV